MFVAKAIRNEIASPVPYASLSATFGGEVLPFKIQGITQTNIEHNQDVNPILIMEKNTRTSQRRK